MVGNLEDVGKYSASLTTDLSDSITDIPTRSSLTGIRRAIGLLSGLDLEQNHGGILPGILGTRADDSAPCADLYRLKLNLQGPPAVDEVFHFIGAGKVRLRDVLRCGLTPSLELADEGISVIFEDHLDFRLNIFPDAVIIEIGIRGSLRVGHFLALLFRCHSAWNSSISH